MNRTVIMVFLALAVVAGCNGPKQEPISDQSVKLLEENISMKTQLTRLEADNKQLNKQIAVLQGLPQDKRLDKVINITQLKVLSKSSFFDKDKDGYEESLYVYFSLIDETGDSLKVPGEVQIELWDMNKPKDAPLLKRWDFSAEELKKKWASSFASQNYRICLDVDDIKFDPDADLVLRVVFTDYISGKVFSEKLSIKQNK